MEYEKKNTGALFQNDKGDNPKRPDYKGMFFDEREREYKLSVWVKTSKKGEKFLSIVAELKEEPHPSMMQPKAHEPKKEYAKEENDDLPF